MGVDDAYTKSLLHFNGADGSNVFTDENGRAWAPLADAQLDTAKFKFGSASGLFDGTGDAIETADHADFTIGSGDFTIDFWIWINVATFAYICAQCNAGGGDASMAWSCYLENTGRFVGDFTVGATHYRSFSVGTLATGAWHHVAVVRYGNTMTNYLNGIADGTTDLTGLTANDSASKLTIGRLGEANMFYFNGWIDEFRFSKGIARWTSSPFTPPTAEYGGGFIPRIMLS